MNWYVIIWRDDQSHYWYRETNYRAMAEAYSYFSRIYLCEYNYRYTIRKNLPPSESKKELGYSYENYLLSYILKNFGEKIHDKFLQNVIRKL